MVLRISSFKLIHSHSKQIRSSSKSYRPHFNLKFKIDQSLPAFECSHFVSSECAHQSYYIKEIIINLEFRGKQPAMNCLLRSSALLPGQYRRSILPKYPLIINAIIIIVIINSTSSGSYLYDWRVLDSLSIIPKRTERSKKSTHKNEKSK